MGEVICLRNILSEQLLHHVALILILLLADPGTRTVVLRTSCPGPVVVVVLVLVLILIVGLGWGPSTGWLGFAGLRVIPKPSLNIIL